MKPTTSHTLTRLPAAFCIGAGCFLTAASTHVNAASLLYSQGFETDTIGWTDDSTMAGFGGITRVPSGDGGITSLSGGFHAELTDIDSTGPFTDFGGYSSVWQGNMESKISVYIDPSKMGTNGGFDYAVAVNNQSGGHLRDFVFHVTNDSDTGTVLVNADSGTSGFPSTNLDGQAGTMVLSAAGWYTLSGTLYSNGGTLFAQMDVLDASNATVFSKTLSSGDVITSDVGGNRYGWFTALETSEPLAIDNVSMSVPEPTAPLLLVAGMASLGLRRRRSVV